MRSGAVAPTMTPPPPDPDRCDPPLGGVEVAPGVRVPHAALAFSFSSSRGPGGQNVNKRATKAELRLRLGDLPLGPAAAARLRALAGARVTGAGELLITSERTRSQERNKSDCLAQLRTLLLRALTPPKPRRRTRPTRGSVERRLTAKYTRGTLKRSRGPEHDE